MKIQGLAVLAIVIILPMAIILGSYSANQIKTLDLQMAYDSRIKVATYDGIKSFQMNMSNSATSAITDSKMRDIKAAIKTFYNSLASQFNMSGYGEDVLQNYVPAIAYTLYDGYYIYSDYKNDLDVYGSDNEDGDRFYADATYKDGEDLYGLKPYIYYSCRYQKLPNYDVVITYSLDSYITIQGKIGSTPINASGYLLSGVEVNGDTVKYRGIEIPEEDNKDGLKQKVYIPDEQNVGTGKEIKITYRLGTPEQEEKTAGVIKECSYKRLNGAKYYIDPDTNKVFSMINDKVIPYQHADPESISKNTTAREFYKNAYEFKQRFQTGGDLSALRDLSVSDAIDSAENKYTTYEGDTNPYASLKGKRIFDELFTNTGTFIEDENSVFNGHRKAVIRNSIESNLTVAISNYNKVSTSEVNFAMPKLKDEEWDELTTNISMITFLQGLNIGGKVYSGYAIVPNDVNEDFVSEDSIYILINGTYYRVTDENLKTMDLSNAVGLLNTDFERRTVEANYQKDDKDPYKVKKNIYYYPREDDGAYSSIITLNSNNGIRDNDSNVNLKNAVTAVQGSWQYKLAQIYYTALGRERYGMHRVNNPFLEPLYTE